MIAEGMTSHVLQGIILALTPTERWSAARTPGSSSIPTEALLIVFAVVAQIVSILIVFRLIAQKKRLEQKRKQEVARLVDAKEELQHKIDKLGAANEDLRHTISQLNHQISVQASQQMNA